MKRLLIAIITSLVGTNGFGQGLVVNGNFEDRNTCVEFLSNCAPEAWFRFPYLKLSPSHPSRIAAHMHHESLVMEHSSEGISGRTYLYTRLVCPAEPGKSYRFRLSILTNGHKFDHLDLVLSKYEPRRNLSAILAGRSDRYLLTITRPASNEDDWMEASVEFKATGEERYLMLGNVSGKTLSYSNKNNTENPLIIYDIDSLSLLPTDKNWIPCKGEEAEKKLLYLNNYRHSDFNFLDDEPAQTPDTFPAAVPAKSKVIHLSPSSLTASDTLLIPDVLFDFDKGTLNKQLLYRMDEILQKIKKKKFRTIEVVGHTDDRGSITYNEQLSELRARSVADYLIDQLQLSSEIITIRRMAASTPIAPNTSNEGRRKNRRVEIILIQ
jgi:outer membrane protein OmpA-like peptidoglycan-associated protein